MDKKEIYGIIYVIRNKVNNKLYIGQTTEKRGFKGRYEYNGEGIERVYNYYKSKIRNNDKYNEHLYSSIEKYGLEAFEVIEEFDIAYNEEELNKLEYMYIEIYQTRNSKYGYNYRFGGNNGRHSEGSKKKMSEAHKGDNSYWYGKRGKETPMYGKHHSEETKKKIKESMKGKNKGEKNYWYGKARGSNPNAKIVYCEELNDIRFSAKDWAEELNICYDSILKCCRGVTKSAGGYHFKFINKEKMYELPSNK